MDLTSASKGAATKSDLPAEGQALSIVHGKARIGSPRCRSHAETVT